MQHGALFLDALIMAAADDLAIRFGSDDRVKSVFRTIGGSGTGN
jgi:hypothetical protein